MTTRGRPLTAEEKQRQREMMRGAFVESITPAAKRMSEQDAREIRGLFDAVGDADEFDDARGEAPPRRSPPPARVRHRRPPE